MFLADLQDLGANEALDQPEDIRVRRPWI